MIGLLNPYHGAYLQQDLIPLRFSITTDCSTIYLGSDFGLVQSNYPVLSVLDGCVYP